MNRQSQFQSLESRVLFSIFFNGPSLTALGNLNAEPAADEVVVNQDFDVRGTEVRLEVGKGNGQFTPSDSTRIPGFIPTAVTIGDVNGDGNADISIVGVGGRIVGPSPLLRPVGTKEEVVVLLGDGNGRFLRATTNGPVIPRVYAVPDQLFATSVAVGDFDGSGAADIAVLGHARATTTSAISDQPSINVLWNVSQPVPTNILPRPVSTLVPLAVNPEVNLLMTGHLNGGASDDLVAAASGRPFFVQPLGMTTTTGPNLTSPARADLAVVSFPSDHTPKVAIGTNPLDGPAAVTGVGVLPYLSTTRTIGLGDLQNNGRIDLIGLRDNAIVYSTYDPTTASFATAQNAHSQNQPAALSRDAIYLADINGDNLPDLLADGGGTTYVGFNTPNSSANAILFSWKQVAPPPIIPPPIIIGPRPWFSDNASLRVHQLI